MEAHKNIAGCICSPCGGVVGHAALRMLGDKEIAVQIRSNSHYRNLKAMPLSSRNAYRILSGKTPQ